MWVTDLDIRIFDYIRSFLDNFKQPIFKSNYRVSTAHEFCVREWVLDEIFRDELYESVNWISKIKMECGTALHSVMQNKILGPAGILWYKWRCLRCSRIYDGFMPKELCSCSEKCKEVCIWPQDKSKRICQLCPQYGDYKYIEPTVSLKIGKKDLVGHVDGLLFFDGKYDVNNIRILEIKTIDPKMFVQLEEPLDSHIIQVTLYMHLLHCKKATIMYIDRSLTALPIFKEFFIEYDYDIIKKVLDIIKECDQYLIDIDNIKFDKLPVRICNTRNDARARKCPYRDKCFDDKYLQEFFKNKILGVR